METKICPKCKTENPIAANFCRACGSELSSSSRNRISYERTTYSEQPVSDNCVKEFTLDKFKHIALQPISVASINFVNSFLLVIDVIFIIASYIYYDSYDIRDFIYDEYGGDTYQVISIIMWLINVLIIIMSINIVVSVYHKIIFNYNATFIEKRFVSTLVRIANKGKLGLFDTRKKSVMLLSTYDSITEFDKEHILIEQNGKKGIYSIAQKRIIVPVSFDSISPFSNSVCSAILNGTTTHYDVKGNRLL